MSKFKSHTIPKAVRRLAPKSSENVAKAVEEISNRHGDLIFDLCQAVLWSLPNAQTAYRSIVRELMRLSITGRFEKHELAWVLKITCRKLIAMSARYGRTLSSSERMMLDGALKGDARLKQFDSYFHRLPTADQILLLLKDKHQIDDETIASALEAPVATLKLQRQHALRALDEMLWDLP